MYRHLLVPIDGTDLAVQVIGHAVALARPLGAHITFFHAVADHAASPAGDAEILRATSPDDDTGAFAARARELLAKAEAAAHAFGVPCGSAHAVSSRPAEAIIDAAREHGCDLIFMASHGRGGERGMAGESQTLGVLMDAGLPVLVSGTCEPTGQARAIGIIRDEHRSIAAVMHAWMHALAEARRAQAGAEPALMRAIVRYVRAFPLEMHHPKEEKHLFERLRARTGTLDAELDELELQHERDRLLVDELSARVERIESGDAAARAGATRELEEAVGRYASFLWEHLGREEGVILPAAQRHLTAEDWMEIDAAFAENRDPDFSGEAGRDFRHLFSRIVNLVEGESPSD